MRHAQTVFRLAVPAAVVALTAACGNGDPDQPGPPADAPQEMPFDVGTAGDVQGMVLFEGEPPPSEPLDMASEPDCAAMYDEQPIREGVQVSDGHLQNVFVYVKEGLEGMDFPIAQDEVVIDQEGCRYIPHVTGVMANQEFILRNSDGLLHNINATPQVNRPFNISQPVNMDTRRSFAQPEVMIPLRCDVHGWMLAYVGVMDHPYHFVTDANGTFDLSELPPGEYVVEAWHSQLGTQEQTVTVETGEVAEITFTFDEGMLAHADVPMADPVDPHDHHHPLDVRARQLGQHQGHNHGEATHGLR